MSFALLLLRCLSSFSVVVVVERKMTRVSELDATWTATWTATWMRLTREPWLFSELCKLVKSFSGFELAASSAALRDIILLNYSRLYCSFAARSAEERVTGSTMV